MKMSDNPLEDNLIWGYIEIFGINLIILWLGFMLCAILGVRVI